MTDREKDRLLHDIQNGIQDTSVLPTLLEERKRASQAEKRAAEEDYAKRIAKSVLKKISGSWNITPK